MARPKKKPKSQVISGGLSTSEKLASKNPAIRDEGRRETANQPQREQRQATERRAAALTGRGFSGVVGSALDVKGPTQQQVAKAFQARGEPQAQETPFIPNQGKTAIPQPVEQQNQLIEQKQIQNDLLGLETQETITSDFNFEDQQNITEPEETDQSILGNAKERKRLQTATLGGLGVGLGVIATVPALAATIAASVNLIATRGLSNPTVFNIATGKFFPQFKRLAFKGVVKAPRLLRDFGPQQAKERLRKSTEYIAAAYNQPMTTKLAKSVVSLATKIVPKKKYQKAIAGIIGNVMLNGFLEEEADQSLSFAIDKSISNENFAQAKEMIAFREELLDLNMWNALRLILPLEGVYKYVQASRFKLEQQKRDFDKSKETIEKGFIPSKVTQAKRQESTAFFENITKTNRERKLAEREEDNKFFEEIREKNKKR